MSNNLPTFETIVVPVDGSELSEAAVPVASAIATPSGARINLVTVVLTYQVPVTSQLDTVTRQSITRIHAGLQARFPGVTQTLLAGDPPEEISNHARSVDAGLIVMATHGRSGLRKLLLGSVADKLVSICPVPVLLVRQNGPLPSSPTSPAEFDRIAIPVDGHEASTAAVPIAIELARLMSLEAVLIYVDEGHGDVDAMRKQANATAERFEASGVTAKIQPSFGEPGKVISEIANKPGTLVVMASLSATGIARGTHRGSVADYIVKHSTAPVMIVPPKGYLGPVVT